VADPAGQADQAAGASRVVVVGLLDLAAAGPGKVPLVDDRVAVDQERDRRVVQVQVELDVTGGDLRRPQVDRDLGVPGADLEGPGGGPVAQPLL
jgi:hypothetical protein